MIALLETVATVAAGLTAGHLFPVMDGADSEINYRTGDYPYKGSADGHPPIGVVLLRSFIPGPGVHRRVVIDLAYTLYSEDLAAAIINLDQLATLLEQLTQPSGQYAPWKLEAATGFVGDRETGAHPDPQYYLTYELVFTKGR
jgi:hypothetical protein